MKTKEELNAMKEEVENVNMKLAELTEEELEWVSGGQTPVKPGMPTLNTSQSNRHESATSRLSERISTGQKINREKDDPASRAISNRLEEQMLRLEE